MFSFALFLVLLKWADISILQRSRRYFLLSLQSSVCNKYFQASIVHRAPNTKLQRRYVQHSTSKVFSQPDIEIKNHSQYRFTFKTIINFYFSIVIFQMAQFIKFLKKPKNCTDSGERFVLCHLPAMATIHCSPLCTTDLFPPQKVE